MLSMLLNPHQAVIATMGRPGSQHRHLARPPPASSQPGPLNQRGGAEEERQIE